jgi:hypothetical protein
MKVTVVAASRIKSAGFVACLPGLAFGLAGCTSTGSLTEQASIDVTTAYTMLCAGLPSLGPTIAKLNAQLQADYATAERICATGAPTNAVNAGLDIVAVYTALSQYIPAAK